MIFKRTTTTVNQPQIDLNCQSLLKFLQLHHLDLFADDPYPEKNLPIQIFNEPSPWSPIGVLQHFVPHVERKTPS